MDRRKVLSLSAATALGLAMLSGNAVAQQVADMDGVKAASKAFYTALAVLDNGEAMEKVWAHTPYVTYVGPRSKTIIVGWDAQKKYWQDVDKLFTQRDVTLSDQHIHVNSSMAYEMGQETGTQKMKDGSTPKLDYITTNVYEKIDGKWLIISHHVAKRQTRRFPAKLIDDRRNGAVFRAIYVSLSNSGESAYLELHERSR